MSRYNPYHNNSEATLNAAAAWRDRCLIADGSILSDSSIWTAATLDEVDARFNGSPDAGKDTFQVKLSRQFAQASPSACQLVAEMLWVMNLFPSNIGAPSKRAAIVGAWTWSGEELAEDHPLLHHDLLSGLGSAGPGFLAHRPRELRFLINATRAFKVNPPEGRRAALADPWEFARWLDAVPDQGYRQLKHILPFLLFPDAFERIASPGDGYRILAGVAGLDGAAIKRLSKVERDEALYELRRSLEAKRGGAIDFYAPEYKNVWAPPERRTAGDAPSRAAPAGGERLDGPPLNLILHGPPGTGKTYRTIDRALEILDPSFAAAQEGDREALKGRFDELTADGRIQFVTFHQSFSYEDFVEGLRAEARADGSIHYHVADGVLKAFCAGPRLRAGTRFASGYTVIRSTDEILWLEKPNGSQLPLPWAILDSLADLIRREVITLEDVRKAKVFDKVPYSRIEKYIVNGYSNILPPILEALISDSRVGSETSVLIIDEINRGNISKIFGELITLIEPSKRAGAAEALSVMLPYSKSRFSVPSGLHIIGTMNTADRSLASVDIALRRRFLFEEVEPDSSAFEGVEVAGVDLAQLLDTINARIEALLDRDHRIGHAYLIGLSASDDLAALRRVFSTQIIPLLQEYFFDDWSRVRLVLNDHRKGDPEDRFIVEQADNLAALFGDGEIQVPTSRGWRLNPRALDRASAYRAILG